MAKVKIDGFMEQLEAEMRKALKLTLIKHFPDADYNDKDVYKTFRKEVVDKCDSWEQLPNKFIK